MNSKSSNSLQIECRSHSIDTCAIEPAVAEQLNDVNAENLTFTNIENANQIRTFEVVSPTGLTAIPAVIFQNFKYLTNVRFIRAGLQKLAIGCFRNANNLRELNLSRNRLTYIPNSTLEHAKSLEYVNLAYNQISDVDENAFYGLGSLKYISLAKNRIDKIFGHQFDGPINLKELDLSDNLIEYLEPIKLRKLEIISLNGNRIKFFPHETFDSMRNLQKINLASNQLTHIDVGLFSKCNELYSLELDNNQHLKMTLNDLRSLATLPALTQLSVENIALNLSQSGSDSDITASASKLLTLNLRSNRLSTPSILKVIASIHPNLHRLELGNNAFTHIEHIEMTRHLFPFLRYIGAGGNNFNHKWSSNAQTELKSMGIDFRVDDDAYY